MKTQNVHLLRNQKGFTLIEIIAVLVILGILAAVAVPKFVDLQTEASQKALDGALSAAYSTCSLQYSKLVLANSKAPTNTELVAAIAGNHPEGTGFTYEFTKKDADGVTCKVTDTAGNTKSGTWTLP